MKQHPDCQPGCAIAMHGSNHDDADADKDFESKWIDDWFRPLPKVKFLMFRTMLTKAPFPENENGAPERGHGRPARENHAQDARATILPREMFVPLLAHLVDHRISRSTKSIWHRRLRLCSDRLRVQLL
jgi:hypothetical protein